ncbi:MAG: hypothetical protein WD063_17390, partial [Pirellulales bacterium]
ALGDYDVAARWEITTSLRVGRLRRRCALGDYGVGAALGDYHVGPLGLETIGCQRPRLPPWQSLAMIATMTRGDAINQTSALKEDTHVDR